jgi:hypothetical protein
VDAGDGTPDGGGGGNPDGGSSALTSITIKAPIATLDVDVCNGRP